MASPETEQLIRQLDEARKETRYFKMIAAQTGNLRLREAENLSSMIQDLKQAKENLSKEIDERKRIENELRASDAKYRSIMESMNDEVYVASQDFSVEYVNPAMISRIGANVIGKPCYKMIFDCDERCPWCPFDKILERTHVDYEVLNPTNNHSYAVTSTPVYQADGSFSKLSIFRDITENKAIEAELRQARKMESIGILAGGIAHDFNNFLQVIIGSTELSLEEIPDWNPAHGYLKTIQKSSLQAKGVVRQLLNFSRKTDSKKKVIDINQVISDTLKILRSTIPNTIEIQHHLPDGNISIQGDNVQISQILINICTNAYQAMEKTGGVLAISVDTIFLGSDDIIGHSDVLPGEYAAIRISDTGPGINPEIMEFIFDPYFTTKETGKGSGMGLAVVHGIVKSHAGIAAVENCPAQGAVFKIFLPLVKEAPCKESTPEEIWQSGYEKILFVDDDRLITEMTEDFLRRIGYSVECRTDPAEALALFMDDPNRFDLVITDMTMPGMTGIELHEKLKTVRADIPTVICTGYSNLISEEKAKKHGIRAFVMKPFSPKYLVKIIRDVLEGNET